VKCVHETYIKSALLEQKNLTTITRVRLHLK